MPLRLVKRNGVYHLRGTVAGKRLQESTRTANRRAAEQIKAKREAELHAEAVYGSRATVTFSRAVTSYIEAGGEKAYALRLVQHFRETKLARIDQAAMDDARRALYPDAAPATVTRQLITPMTAILTHASKRGWCDRPSFDRPKEPPGRTRWLSVDEAEALIAASADHLRPMVVTMLYTGARLGEAMFLDWREVDLMRSSVRYVDTKNGMARGVPLHPRAVAELANVNGREGPVFRRADGEPFDVAQKSNTQIKAAWKAARRAAGLSDDVTPHTLRHTWASWHYGANRDVYALMALGGWQTISMVQRYTHVNVDTMAAGILALPNRRMEG
jgi:integrase